MKHDPITADGAEALAGYKPVPLAPRRNGWTAHRQRTFLSALAETGSVSVACKAAGISARSAYRLRADPRGAPFAKAWAYALYMATHALTAIAFERATKGSYREYWKDGRLIGETRQPSDTMLKFLLTRLAPSMFNCPTTFNGRFVKMAQDELPGLLDALTDCDVQADRLTDSDYDFPPREVAHDPLIKPGIEDDSWEGDDDYVEDEFDEDDAEDSTDDAA